MSIDPANSEPDELDAVRPAVLPSGYYRDFLEILQEYRGLVAVISYDALPWGNDYDYAKSYPREWRRWQAEARSGQITIVIQHDVDSVPARSWLASEQEEQLGIPSCFMIFHRRLNRKWYEASGELRVTEYEVEWDRLRRLEQKGWCIGYHSNALDQARFDDALAREIFLRDVAALRTQAGIRYFSPHGGLRSPEGRTNNQLRPPDLKRLGLRWVQNGASPRFHGHWSDGGLRSTKVDPESRDLRQFLLRMELGKRYRVLTHPQYYDEEFDGTGWSIAATDWYREIESSYRAGRGREAWDDVRRRFDALRNGASGAGM